MSREAKQGQTTPLLDQDPSPDTCKSISPRRLAFCEKDGQALKLGRGGCGQVLMFAQAFWMHLNFVIAHSPDSR